MTVRLICALLVAFTIAGCAKETLQSKWYAPEQTTEMGTFRFYHADSKIRYNVRNDGANLYLSMDMAERLTMMKVLQTGLRIFIGNASKKSERNELQFPIYVDKYELTASDMEPNDATLDRLEGRSNRLESMLPTEGYLKMNGAVTSIFNGQPLPSGATVLMRLDKDRALVYEAVIPLSFFGEMTGPVAIGIETGAFKFPSEEIVSQSDITSAQQVTAGDRAMGRNQTQDPYGMNTPTGSTNMGMNQRAITRTSVMEEPIRFWITVELAKAGQ